VVVEWAARVEALVLHMVPEDADQEASLLVVLLIIKIYCT